MYCPIQDSIHCTDPSVTTYLCITKQFGWTEFSYLDGCSPSMQLHNSIKPSAK